MKTEEHIEAIARATKLQDAARALRAPHGQAPAVAAPAAVAGPIGYGPKVTVRRSCSDCKACNSESYAVQGDSGHYVYCEHPSLPESKYIGDTNWNTPHWCPVSAPTTQPAPQQEPSHTSVQLAEMVLSDCGHSSNYTPLLERVAVRIDAHVERRLDELRGCLESRPLPAAQEDAVRLERERICAAIKAEDDYCIDQGDYMLDSDDCIKIVRGEWVRPEYPVGAARAAQEDKSCPKE